MFLKGGQDGSVDTLVGTLSLTEAIEYCRDLSREIEQDNPELSLYRELRAMQQVTAPGGTVLVGDVDAKREEASSNYDNASISLFRMAVAIGGERLRRGDWRTPGKAQQKFAPFNLETYASGGFDGLGIMPRPLFADTEASRIEMQIKRASYANSIENRIPESEYLRIVGYDDKRQAELQAEQTDENNEPPVEP
jgi:hypothetical protein